MIKSVKEIDTYIVEYESETKEFALKAALYDINQFIAQTGILSNNIIEYRTEQFHGCKAVYTITVKITMSYWKYTIINQKTEEEEQTNNDK